MPATSVTDARLLRRKLDIADMLGPATLAYLDPAGFRPQPDLSVIEQFGARDPLLRRFLSRQTPRTCARVGSSRSPLPPSRSAKRPRSSPPPDTATGPDQLVSLLIAAH